ncbi:MAG: peptidase dimerization domain-containing protein [Verrucomicrobiaceae bacterium]|nr:peptidase dimerization domain-containing protein [Verrucomicrobiaceae bacterium]
MAESTVRSRPPEAVLAYPEALRGLREILFANVVMAGEIPAPTGSERRITRFLSDRFTECGLDNISLDQAGNVAGVISGRTGRRNLLVAAHVDKIWAETEDHTVSVGVGEMSGRGLADNSLGIAVLATLPLVLDELGIHLDANLILLGTTRSFGRGNLRGMRFFLENSAWEIASALCLEGIDLGRLSFSSLGMARGEIAVERAGLPGEEASPTADASVIAILSELTGAMLEIHRRGAPDTSLLIGSIEAGSGYSVAPRQGRVRFEIRSLDAARVAEVEAELAALVERLATREGTAVRLEIIARRRPGDLGRGHPLVREAGKILAALGIASRVEPSVSELAALLDRRIPSLTLGLTKGKNRHSPEESISLDPIFDGLAQLVSLLQFMDEGDFATAP